MIFDAENMTAAEFSKAERLAEKKGSAVISKNKQPKYALVDLSQNPILDLTDDEKIEIIAKRVFVKYRAAFEELAK